MYSDNMSTPGSGGEISDMFTRPATRVPYLIDEEGCPPSWVGCYQQAADQLAAFPHSLPHRITPLLQNPYKNIYVS